MEDRIIFRVLGWEYLVLCMEQEEGKLEALLGLYIALPHEVRLLLVK